MSAGPGPRSAAGDDLLTQLLAEQRRFVDALIEPSCTDSVAQIHALGNGVVPLQAETALRRLLHDAGLCPATTGTASGSAVAGRWAA